MMCRCSIGWSYLARVRICNSSPCVDKAAWIKPSLLKSSQIITVHPRSRCLKTEDIYFHTLTTTSPFDWVRYSEFSTKPTKKG